MPFQKTVLRKQGAGVVGDIVIDGPRRAQAARMKTAGGSFIGRAVTYDTTNGSLDYDVVQGGTGKFAGIIANSKTTPLRGAVGDSLSPSLAIAQYQQCEVVSMTSGLVVALGSGSEMQPVGSPIYFNNATGEIVTKATEPQQGLTVIAGARLVRYSSEAYVQNGQNLAVIELTGANI